MTNEQRTASGKALRAVVSRESHASFIVDPNRDPLPILTAGDASRVPSLVPERYKRMAESPFAFLRGAAAVMARDLAGTPVVGLPVQACGDCHLMNFGVFASPEGNILFDINDFDETHPGVDAIVDLKRLVASVAVAAQNEGLSDKKAHALAQSTAKAYRDFMSDLAERTPLHVWQTRMDLKDQLAGFGEGDVEIKALEKLAKAASSSKPSLPIVSRDGTLRFAEKASTVSHQQSGQSVGEVFNANLLAKYKTTLLAERSLLLDRYDLTDVAFKVVGVGSVGTYCAVGLMATADGEPIVLQLKQAQESAIAPLARHAAVEKNQGRRVVDGQRAMQAASDIFLGWARDDTGRMFYLRELKNRTLGSITDLMEGKGLPGYATLCGRTLARAHARTGDAATITGYFGKSSVIDEALADFALAYASQTVLDHAKLLASPLVPATVVEQPKKAA